MNPTRVHSLSAAARARAAERIRKHAVPGPDGCVVWIGRLDRYGYGAFRVSQGGTCREIGAHRAAWLALRGDIPDGLVIDHLCRNRACVNLDHLELVTGAENTRRSPLVGRAAGDAQSGKTECVNGHPFTEENTHLYVSRDGYAHRICIACRRQRAREHKQRAGAAS